MKINKQVKSEDGGKGCYMHNNHNIQQPQVYRGMFTDVATLFISYEQIYFYTLQNSFVLPQLSLTC